MPSKMRQQLLFYIVVIALLLASVMISYAEKVNYIYDENNRLIQVIYENGREGGVIYNYDASGNRTTLEIQPPDREPPTGTITINSGDPITSHQDVTLTLSCSDDSGCSQMQFSNDDVTYSTPEAYGTTKSWTLSAGDGTKTVYAKFKDVPGNWSTAYSDTIELRTTDSYTKSLLHMNGVDGSTTFTDMASSGTHTWTAYGNAQIDTAQSKFGGASGLFDGASDYIKTPDSDDFDFGSGDFTFDFWMRLNNNATYQMLFSQRYDAGNVIEICFYGASDDSIRFVAKSGGTIITYFYTGAQTLSTGQWHHIAIVRNGDTPLIFIDGVSKSVTQQVSIAGKTLPNIGGADAWIGGYTGGTYWFNGWLDEYRISKGIARWTANFTPPTQEY